MWRPVVRVASSRPTAPRLRALCTQKPAAPPAGSSGKEVAAEPTTTNRNKDGVATYNYGESLNLPEVTKEQAENAYLEATDVTRAMTPPISVAVEARDDMLKDRFNYVGVPPRPRTPDEQAASQAGRVLLLTRVRLVLDSQQPQPGEQGDLRGRRWRRRARGETTSRPRATARWQPRSTLW